MKLTATRLAMMAISFLFVFTACKDEDTPTEPLEGSWTLYSGYLESQTEIPSRNITTDPSSCFYDGQDETPVSGSSNPLTLNANQTGSFSWNIRCTPPDNYSFTWRLSGDNELTFDHTNGETWVWSITSLSSEFMEVDFYRERAIELQFSGPATAKETFQLKFRKVE